MEEEEEWGEEIHVFLVGTRSLGFVDDVQRERLLFKAFYLWIVLPRESRETQEEDKTWAFDSLRSVVTSSEIDEERRNKEEEMRSMGLNRVLIKNTFLFFFFFSK